MPHRDSYESLDLNQLRTFLAVHRAGSFTAAAQLLGLSQPTVTAQMRALERRLGRRLFERLPRGVASTAMAEQLAAEVSAPLDALSAVAGGDQVDETAAADPVHLAGPAELLCARVLPSLAPLVGAGDLRLRVTLGLADDLLAGLRAGQYDLVVSTIRPRGRALTAEPLADEEFVLVAAPDWAERIGGGRLEREGPSALRDAPLVTYAEDLPIARRYWRHVFGTRLAGPAAVVVPDLRGVLAAVVAGAGFTVLPRYLCHAELDSGALVALLEPVDPPINTGFLAQRAGLPDNPNVTLVRDRLLEAARDW
ncbi:LysR family transcriptional regulator [Actinomadura barringtoniae]|uniref:LysR family transcriptional regulator n=1 Tax=Actinomadura barringtoniae TaxID=1427535 RepID=A0A939PE64_9ACTN|nr:LysR family transcriptional regulator [Actinomadura barringtoniae]MBO2450673.1 LysR family transcriptional regulator [Actinomadura barringtoniae]